MLFKPSTNAAFCGPIGATLLEAVDPGALHVIVGKSSVIEAELLEAPELKGVSLTGSYATAAAMRRRLPVEIPFQAELGGKNTLVIWRDADLDLALDVVDQSAFRNNGQICTSAGRLLVDEIFDAFVARLSGSLRAPRTRPAATSSASSSHRGRPSTSRSSSRSGRPRRPTSFARSGGTTACRRRCSSSRRWAR